MQKMNRKKIISAFEIPDEGIPVMDHILRQEEQRLISVWPENQICTDSQLIELMLDKKIASDTDMACELIQSMFRRGVINKTQDGSCWCLGNFYGRLDIFAVDEKEIYDSLPRSRKESLDRWYFQAYVEGMDSPEENPYPTDDEVLPLNEVLDFIEKRTDTPWLAVCDCRRLIQNCSQPVETCITYRTAPNSFVRRGLARPITKEEAKEIVMDADRRGLIHTVNSGGICSCCTDCCYLFRAAKYRNSLGIWPKVTFTVVLDPNRCIGCGRCRMRCRFSVFSSAGSVCVQNPDQCQGCGLCVTACPVGALNLKKRYENEHSS